MGLQVQGIDRVVAIYEESTFGEDPAVPDGHILPHRDFNIKKTQNRIDSEVIAGSRARTESALGNVDVAGDIPTELGAESFGTLLKHLMGVNNTTGAGPYVHVMTIGALPTGLTLEVDNGPTITGTGRYMKHQGCKLASCAFSFPQEGVITITPTFTGVDTVFAAAPLDATLTDHGHRSFSGFDAVIEEGGSALTDKISSIDFTVDNGLDTGSYVIGSGGKRVDLPAGFVGVTGSIKVLFKDMVMLNKAINNTESSLKITAKRGDGLGSAGNESIEFLMNQLKYEPATPESNGPNGVGITLNFKAYLKAADLGLQITLKNAVATI